MAELRPFVEGEILPDSVSISKADKDNGSPKAGDMIARNPKNHDDQWLVAEQYFKDNFDPAQPKTMCFAQALGKLEDGHLVARKGWNGKGMYIWYVPATTVALGSLQEIRVRGIAMQNGGTVSFNPHIRMRCSDGSVTSGWVPSQVDMFARDWEVVGHQAQQ